MTVPLSAAAQGQVPRDEPPAPRCTPAAWAVRDSIDLPLLLRVRAFDAEQGVPDDFLDRAARAIAERLALPTPLVPAAFGFGRIDDTTTTIAPLVHPALYAVARTIIARDGGPDSVALATSSADSVVDAALMRAVEGADSARAFAEYPSSVSGASIDLRVELSTADSTEMPPHWVMVRRIRVPRYGDWATPILRPRSPGPRYPDELRKDGLEGGAIAHFLVDVDGKTDMATTRIVAFSHPLFARSVYTMLHEWRFRPAEVAGCSVPVWIRMPFYFNTSSWLPGR
jgi:TonB family protein